MDVGFNHDKIMKNIDFKYAVPIIAAKRAEKLKDNFEMKNTDNFISNRNFVNDAFKEIEEGKTNVKDVDKLEMIKTDTK
ncbi:DNA-directed RNA polymerase subunit omega [Oceanotoga sp. DSM 15011]|jgi:DNA-directed RNA polymerase subunit omega|uniref:DNA-directed RNA polymerase subunit omega n=1 Tax=Oceanotoga teriensis TaxID=515440 RepID=A0AA45HJ50_9BACT|nr:MULTISPECIES: DNA-directed RNA polymerase subunit omega [Oceanotoga]MDN5343192.1 DNA-directed polymerase subunit omega [Oceanotoga sp.]MDO7976262.1 DNA-directed RNA polymerase subunit omega [Oceanotoga teriensis]PWJ95459.1 DNA-directed RNA polymerase subunit omega [Oceanotoga teriensis]UYP01098.1 DNA-directed RNA polymerase subunit omega [Oceanotoga sp. DSM 15011]